MSLALIVDDPDAPTILPWVHWVVYNMPSSLAGLPERSTAINYPEEALSGMNDFGSNGYGGPCPPSGTHRYVFKLYALDSVLPDLLNPTKADLVEAMEGHIIAETVLIGTYSYP